MLTEQVWKEFPRQERFQRLTKDDFAEYYGHRGYERTGVGIAQLQQTRYRNKGMRAMRTARRQERLQSEPIRVTKSINAMEAPHTFLTMAEAIRAENVPKKRLRSELIDLHSAGEDARPLKRTNRSHVTDPVFDDEKVSPAGLGSGGEGSAKGGSPDKGSRE